MNLELIVGAFYLVSVCFVAYAADERGHSFGTAFLAGILTTPIIAAILYAPYPPAKVKSFAGNSTPEANWSAAQISLKQRYEKGEISVEDYQKQWNELSK